MNVIKAREAWMRTRPALGDPEDDLRNAFAAGWNAARPPIRGTSSGHASHNTATAPGALEVTVWGRTRKGREIALVMDEAAAARLRADLDRFGIGL